MEQRHLILHVGVFNHGTCTTHDLSVSMALSTSFSFTPSSSFAVYFHFSGRSCSVVTSESKTKLNISCINPVPFFIQQIDRCLWRLLGENIDNLYNWRCSIRKKVENIVAKGEKAHKASICRKGLRKPTLARFLPLYMQINMCSLIRIYVYS